MRISRTCRGCSTEPAGLNRRANNVLHAAAGRGAYSLKAQALFRARAGFDAENWVALSSALEGLAHHGEPSWAMQMNMASGT